MIHIKRASQLPAKVREQLALESPRKPRKPRGAKRAKVSPSLFQAACVAHGLPEPRPEFQFDATRKWRFDWSWWPHKKVALEIEGGAWLKGGGRHNRGKGFLGDMEKYNRAALLGWRVLRCTPADVKSGKVFALLREVLG